MTDITHGWYRDRHKISFADAQIVLAQLDGFPPFSRVGANDGMWALDDFAKEFETCWACGCCGVPGGMFALQIHHIVGSSRRDHRRFNFARLCRTCHEAVAGNTSKVLWCKFKHDHEQCDWSRLIVLRNSMFERGPEPPPNGEFWLPGFQNQKVSVA